MQGFTDYWLVDLVDSESGHTSAVLFYVGSKKIGAILHVLYEVPVQTWGKPGHGPTERSMPSYMMSDIYLPEQSFELNSDPIFVHSMF